MKVTIEINCDNAAFEGSPRAEVQRILQNLIEMGEPLEFCDAPELVPNTQIFLRDINGNGCGRMIVSRKGGA